MEFQVIAKHVILTNNLLQFSRAPGDRGGEDRFDTVPFEMRFDPNAAEVTRRVARGEYCKLADRIAVVALKTTHLSQLFSYFVQGAMQWYANNMKLPRPNCLTLATASTLSENDRVQQFINDFTQRTTIGGGSTFKR